jgi:hypothetical protein
MAFSGSMHPSLGSRATMAEIWSSTAKLANMRRFAAILLYFPLLAHVHEPERDAYGYYKRSKWR